MPERPGRDSNVVGTVRRTIEVGGVVRSYLVHEPARQLRPPSLVVALHGGGGDGVGTERLTGLSALAERFGFVVLYPDGVGGFWNDAVPREGIPIPDVDDVGFLVGLVERHADGVDRSGVLFAGISNGGHMSGRMGVEASHAVGAIVPVGATLSRTYAVDHTPEQGVSVLAFHGTDDPLRFFGGGGSKDAGFGDTMGAPETAEWWARANGCDPEPTIEELSDRAGEGMPVTVHRYGGGRDGSEVRLHTIHGGGHTWPGGLQYFPEDVIGRTTHNVDASAAIGDFLALAAFER